MSPEILIIGAGGHGRGVLEILAADAESTSSACGVVGFLDDSSANAGREIAGVPVLGTLDQVEDHVRAGRSLILGVGEPSVREDLVGRFASFDPTYANAIHPAATIYRGVQMSPGVVIGAGVVVAAMTRIGRHGLVNLGATIGHDCLLGDYATVAPGANLGGNVTLGEGAFVGINGTIIPGLELGAWSKVGAGTVLLEDLPAERVAFGVPGRIVDRISRRNG